MKKIKVNIIMPKIDKELNAKIINFVKLGYINSLE
tara:strand:- start:60 stop:164 length:105 start_codon:yes stop_codon:yes gene_type:complete